jgi:hypothetical protein
LTPAVAALLGEGMLADTGVVFFTVFGWILGFPDILILVMSTSSENAESIISLDLISGDDVESGDELTGTPGIGAHFTIPFELMT